MEYLAKSVTESMNYFITDFEAASLLIFCVQAPRNGALRDHFASSHTKYDDPDGEIRRFAGRKLDDGGPGGSPGAFIAFAGRP